MDVRDLKIGGDLMQVYVEGAKLFRDRRGLRETTKLWQSMMYDVDQWSEGGKC